MNVEPTDATFGADATPRHLPAETGPVVSLHIPCFKCGYDLYRAVAVCPECAGSIRSSMRAGRLFFANRRLLQMIVLCFIIRAIACCLLALPESVLGHVRNTLLISTRYESGYALRALSDALLLGVYLWTERSKLLRVVLCIGCIIFVYNMIPPSTALASAIRFHYNGTVIESFVPEPTPILVILMETVFNIVACALMRRAGSTPGIVFFILSWAFACSLTSLQLFSWSVRGNTMAYYVVIALPHADYYSTLVAATYAAIVVGRVVRQQAVAVRSAAHAALQR